MCRGSRWFSLPDPSRTLAASMRRLVVLIGLVGVVVSACGGGGSAPSAVTEFNDTWLWDGSDWAHAQTSTVPSPRTDPAIAYDDATRQVVLFGGRSTTDLS